MNPRPIHYLALSFIGSIIYLAVHAYLGNIGSISDMRFLPDDSSTYLSVGSWLMGPESLENVWRPVVIRPFGYPIILYLCELLGPSTLMIVQLSMWLAGANVLFYIASKESRIRDGLIFAVGYLLLFSLPLMTVFALTETALIFFVSLSILSFYKHLREGKPIIWAFFYLAIAVVVRPSFLYVFLLGALMILIVNRKQLAKSLIFILLAASPIILQSYNMNRVAGTFSPSLIGELSVEDYWLVRAIAIQEGISIMESRERSRAALSTCWSSADLDKIKDYKLCVSRRVLSFAKAYPLALIKAFVVSVWENLNVGSEEIYLVDSKFERISKLQNQVVSMLGILMSAVVLGFLGFRFIKDRNLGIAETLLGLLSINILFQYLITGLSYYQGDRFSIINYLAIFILGSILWGYFKRGSTTS